MKTLSFQVPETLDIDSNEIAMIVASTLYEKGKLSLGQAADIAGISKRTFVEIIGKYGVSIFNAPASDLASDMKNA